MDIRSVNSLVLAYLGDALYSKYIRLYLINKGLNKVDELQKESIKYVSAKRQAYYLDKMVNDNFFKEDEITIIKRARNTKSHANTKGCSIIEYKKSTALEALLGYLKLKDNISRVEEIMYYIINN